MKTSPITKILGIKYPIIQASLNWLTDAKFVAAVSNAGGMGTLGPNAGKTRPDQNATEMLKKQIAEAKKLTDKPFAVNMIVNSEDNFAYPDKTFKAAFDAGVRIFILSGAINPKLFKEIKDSGSTLIFRELNPSVEGAKKAESLGVDILIATGYDEGGIIPTTGLGTFTTIPRIVDAVSIPVVGAGGIMDVRGVRAAFALGAQGVYVGTRFIVTDENRTSYAAKQKIIDSTVDDVVLVSPNQRSIKNPMADKWAKEFNNGVKDTYQQTREAGGVRPAMLDGKLDDGVISIDVGINDIHDIKSVKEVVDEMMQDFEN
ncbi:2-nitropropane dioxygenase NPD [Fructilactobacillus fructivorans]|uniref:NAD(P)H-dependent flavin oxidoreductase n=1 Tax=Fructilactobacillus fructivorans TaxID=1614 RepID=UPI000705251F|nr:nitronate monooxygenase [Fructilactobacillus fructivorans]KRN13002.1 2-nitropropane dioxygenase NPD [Fructilactobacillus fructivorans]